MDPVDHPTESDTTGHEQRPGSVAAAPLQDVLPRVEFMFDEREPAFGRTGNHFVLGDRIHTTRHRECHKSRPTRADVGAKPGEKVNVRARAAARSEGSRGLRCANSRGFDTAVG